jgi:hypothetical protein
MKNPIVWFAIILIAAGGGAFYFWKERSEREARLEQLPPEKPAAAQAEPPATSAEPEIAHPLPDVQPRPPGTERKPLPALDESDEPLREALAAPLGRQALNDIVITKDIARKIVATIDNLPRKKLAERLLPVKPPSGQFLTSGQGEIVTLSAANYARYSRYVKLAQAVDAKQLVTLYVELYPLFQQAYQQLGYPKKQFNDRLIQAIDDLLAAPAVPQPVELVRPKVLYEFEDPALEDLSAGQKIMVRIGPEQAAAMKAKLREIRRELTADKALAR